MAEIADAHLPEHAEQAGLYALEVLEGDERSRFERHLAECETCARLVEHDRQTLARLSAAAPERDAPRGFKERLLERADAELKSQSPSAGREPARVIPLEAERRRRRAWLASLAAVLVVALAIGGLLGQQVYGNQVLATATLQGTGTSGSASVVVRRSGASELQLQGLPDPPAGKVYEAWVIPQGGQPIPAGTLASGAGTVALQAPPLGRTVAVTLEQAPGVSAPTSQPLLAGTVGA